MHGYSPYHRSIERDIERRDRFIRPRDRKTTDSMASEIRYQNLFHRNPTESITEYDKLIDSMVKDTKITKRYGRRDGMLSTIPRHHRTNVNCFINASQTDLLDLPQMIDDYYLNLLDWSSRNVIAVALGDTIYTWNPDTKAMVELLKMEGESNYITSLSFLDDGSYLAVGNSMHEVKIWDMEESKLVRIMKGHTSRVSSISWNNHILSSGSRDGLIMNSDVRKPQHGIGFLQGHNEEVCGLKWSTDGTQLASGGNDNLLNVWDYASCATPQNAIRNSRVTKPRFTFTAHTAAVKALAWCPWQRNLLASGGGTADKKIVTWDTKTGAMVKQANTGSQVSNILWSKTSSMLISSHGFSQNQLIVWNYPDMRQLQQLHGHESRVLYMAQSPDGCKIASASGDETMRLWNVFPKPDQVPLGGYNHCISALSLKALEIR